MQFINVRCSSNRRCRGAVPISTEAKDHYRYQDRLRINQGTVRYSCRVKLCQCGDRLQPEHYNVMTVNHCFIIADMVHHMDNVDSFASQLVHDQSC